MITFEEMAEALIAAAPPEARDALRDYYHRARNDFWSPSTDVELVKPEVVPTQDQNTDGDS